MDGFSSRGGWIEVITGGMFSGKSEELIRRIRRAEIARQRSQIFKPAIDDRFELKRVISRDNRGMDAIAVANSAGLRANIVFGVKVVGIDEVQFFDDEIVFRQVGDQSSLAIRDGARNVHQRRLHFEG
jgi:thymidine kinase